MRDAKEINEVKKFISLGLCKTCFHPIGEVFGGSDDRIIALRRMLIN